MSLLGFVHQWVYILLAPCNERIADHFFTHLAYQLVIVPVSKWSEALLEPCQREHFRILHKGQAINTVVVSTGSTTKLL